MVVKRLFAVAFAIIAIAGAFLFRNWRESGGTLSFTGTALPVVCDEAIADACRDVFDDVRSVAPGTTFDQMLADPEAASFVWITADVWFDMVDDERSRGVRTPTFGDRSGELVHSPLVIAGPGVPGCDPVSFSCLADRDLDADLGIEDRFDTSAGLLAFGQLAFERNGASNANLRWSESEGAELEEGDIRTLLNYQNAGGRYDLVIVTEALFESLGPDDVASSPADASVAITIEAAVVGDGGLPKLDDLIDALVQAGWRAEPADTFDGPSAGGLIALRRS